MQASGRKLCVRPLLARFCGGFQQKSIKKTGFEQTKAKRSEIYKFIVRKPEWRNQDGELNIDLLKSDANLGDVIDEIAKYFKLRTVTSTQYINMIDLLDTIPASNKLDEKTKQPKIHIEQAKVVFNYLDDYTFKHYFEMNLVYPSITTLLKLQRFLNNEFVMSSEINFGGSLVNQNLETIFRSRYIKSKAVDLFIHNCTRAYNYNSKDAFDSEFDGILKSSNSKLNFNPRNELGYNEAADESQDQSLAGKGA